MKPNPLDLKAESLRAALEAIAAAHSGVLNPHDVVRAASDPLSALHDQFEWDDLAAGDQYRLAQAGALVRRVRLTIMRTAAETKVVTVTTTRAYQSRQSQRSIPTGGYEGISAIMGDEEKRQELLAQVLRELGAYRRRYTDLTELQDLWDAFDDVRDQLAPNKTHSSSERPSAPLA